MCIQFIMWAGVSWEVGGGLGRSLALPPPWDQLQRGFPLWALRLLPIQPHHLMGVEQLGGVRGSDTSANYTTSVVANCTAWVTNEEGRFS